MSRLEEEVEQLRVQLAGCLVAAEGSDPNHPTEKGSYGWSLAYQTTVDLRELADTRKKDVDHEIKMTGYLRGAFGRASEERDGLKAELAGMRSSIARHAQWFIHPNGDGSTCVEKMRWLLRRVQKLRRLNRKTYKYECVGVGDCCVHGTRNDERERL